MFWKARGNNELYMITVALHCVYNNLLVIKAISMLYLVTRWMKTEMNALSGVKWKVSGEVELCHVYSVTSDVKFKSFNGVVLDSISRSSLLSLFYPAHDLAASSHLHESEKCMLPRPLVLMHTSHHNTAASKYCQMWLFLLTSCPHKA